MFNFIAHELRAWLLHYSPLVLLKILQDDYYQHHLLLVEGVLKDTVRQADVIQSSRLLNQYCFMFSPLYGNGMIMYVNNQIICFID